MPSLCAVPLATAMTLLSACSGSSTGEPSTEEVGLESQAASEDTTLASCPAKLDAANGRACTEGLECTFSIECRTMAQQATCACKDGALECRDAQGVLPPGSSARCLETDNAESGECPATIEEAAGAPCGVLGHQCHYEGLKCPERPARYLDSCECMAVDGADDGSKAFKCHVGQCL